MRYSRGAAWIHWITGVLLRFADLPRGAARIELFTVHKTLGATILLAAGIRLAYRLLNPPPPYPAELPKWDRFAAVWSHRIV